MITGIVLAGGAGQRIRCRKAMIEINGVSLIKMVCDRISAVCSEIVVVGSQPSDPLPDDVVGVDDTYPGCGPLAGVHAGLSCSCRSHAVVVACDMPFLNVGLLQYMAEKAREGYDVVVPRTGTFLEPLHAVYRCTLSDKAEKLILAGERQVRALFAGSKVYEVADTVVQRFDPEGLAFFNLNTRTDLTRARELMRITSHEEPHCI